jgi:hypothetical protein
MKTLLTTYDGSKTTLIGASGSAPRRRLFDKWHSHAAGYVSYGGGSAASGNYYNYATFQLKDGNYYFYWIGTIQTYDSYQVFWNSAQYYVPPGYPNVAPGEGFNKIYRPALGGKIPGDQFLDWYNSH